MVLYVMIVLLLLTQLIVGCSGRRGPFMELGVGMRGTVANKEWTASKYSDRDYRTNSSLIEQTHHDVIATTVSPSGNLKIGLGLTDQLLFSGSFSISELKTLGVGITYFKKETAPSMFFDITLPGSIYLQNFSNGFYANVPGRGFNAGVGYEFKRRLAVRGEFAYGTYDVDTTDLDDIGWGVLAALVGVSPAHTAYEGNTKSFSFGLTVSYIWY